MNISQVGSCACRRTVCFPLYTAWHLANAARISNQVTLTKLDMIGF
jgi:hypothetical protein